MNLTKKLLATAVVITAASSVAGIQTFSAFSGTTTNAANAFAAGTVVLGDNDSDAAMYNLTNQKPAAAVTTCIKVTYTGSLDAAVKLYTPDTIGTLGQYVDLTVTPGTGNITGTSCTGFTADGSDLYAGTLAAFATSHSSYTNGLTDNPGTTATKWVANDAVVYRFTLTLQDNNSAQGLTTGTHAFKWEARNL